MQANIIISEDILDWVISRVSPGALSSKLWELLCAWKDGVKVPTYNQIEKISKASGIPLGYFFLKTPPVEDTSFVEYRTVDSAELSNPSRNLIDIMHDMEIIQDWFDCSPLHVDIPIFRKWLEEMNKDGKYLKWNIAVSGDKKSDTRWKIAGADVGKIERSKKTKHPEFIDIGSLRSGIDVLADVNPAVLTPAQSIVLATALKNKKNLIAVRHELGLGDMPLLLLYRIDRHKGKDSKYRAKIESVHDIIGFSIIVSGEEVSSDYVKTIHVKIPE